MNTLSVICSLNTFPANTYHSSMYETAKKNPTKHASLVKTEPKLHSFNSDFTLCLPNSLIAGHLIKRSCANLSDTINPISNNAQQLVHFHNDKGIIRNPLIVPVFWHHIDFEKLQVFIFVI